MRIADTVLNYGAVMSKYKPWANLEREITRDFESIGWKAERLWSKQMKEEFGVDVIAEKGLKRCMVQVKHQLKPNMRKAWQEAKKESVKSDYVIAVCRFKGSKDTLAIIEWGKLKKLFKKL